MHIGARVLGAQRMRFARSQVCLIPARTVRAQGVRRAILPYLQQLRARVDQVYLHLDIDVLDPSEAPGVDFRTPHGLTADEVQQVVRAVGRLFRIRAANLTAFNPSRDEGDKTVKAALRLIKAVTNAAAGGRRGGSLVSSGHP